MPGLGEEIDCSCVCGIEFLFFLALLFFSVNLCVLHSGAGYRVAVKKHQLVVTSLDCCFRYSGDTHPPYSYSPDCWSSCNMSRKMSKGLMEEDRCMVVELEDVVSLQNLGRRQVLLFIRAGTAVCIVVVRLVVVFSSSFLVMEVECLRVGFWLLVSCIFSLGQCFVVMVVGVEMEN